MVQAFNWSKGSIGSRIKLVHRLNGSWVKLVQGSNCFKGSIGSMDQLVKGINRLKGSDGSRDQLVQDFNWFKCLIGSSVHLFN